MAVDRQTVCRELAQRFPSEVADALISTLKPSVRITLVDPSVAVPLGGSHFGGSAHVPHDFIWPTWQGFSNAPFAQPEPLALLAQINLAELPKCSELGLPEHGQLLVFMDMGDELVFGGAHEYLDRWRVCFIDVDAALLKRIRPASVQPVEIGVRFELEWMFDHEVIDHLEQSQAIHEFCNEQLSQSVEHRLCGHPQYIQYDPSSEAEITLRQDANHTVYREDHEEIKSKWQLLLQLNFEEALDWSWGDAGAMYFMIPRQDFQKQDFSRVMAVLQCC